MLLHLGTDLRDITELTRLAIENIDLVIGHFLLCDEDFLATVDDEVAALIVGALVEGTEVVLYVILNQHAIPSLEHDRNLSREAN